MALPPGAGPILIAHARAAIAGRLGLPVARPPEPAWLDDDGAVFVTLTIGGNLRGCIGSLEAHQAILDDVRDNARSAAFRDPRFPPLTAAEYAQTEVEVSVLSPPEPMVFASEAGALEQLRPGVDGVILHAAGRRATFLPQVWEQLPDKAEFMAHLKRKAGLPAGYWGPDVKLWRYGVTAFHDADE
jgi:AmmeMemoRadiSam system protein A